jgi:hypothetical protein
MQTIETRYLPDTNTRPRRITAKQSGGGPQAKQVTISRDSAPDDDNEAHGFAARTLAEKIGWHGELIGGHTREGMVWVFVESLSPRIQLGEHKLRIHTQSDTAASCSCGGWSYSYTGKRTKAEIEAEHRLHAEQFAAPKAGY